jgi:hypothetical protein
MRGKLAAALGCGAVVVLVAIAVAAAFGVFRTTARHSAHGLGDAIGVHGAWKIELRNPDGRTVAVRRFHNDLTGGGDIISLLLTSSRAPGFWEVALMNAGDASQQPCTSSFQPNAMCTMTQPGNSAIFFGGHVFQNLTAATAGGGVRLQGQAFADHAGTITDVRTAMMVCAASVAPSGCNSANWQLGEGFSARSISALGVVAGQQILTTVTYTFSTV